MGTSETEKKGFGKKLLFFLKLVEIRLRFVAILVVTALVVGYWDNIQNYYERWQRAHGHAAQATSEHAAQGAYEYFCPMHPFVVREAPGNCPICGMDLVQRKRGAPTELPAGVLTRVQVSPERIMQAGVRVEPVAYRHLLHTVRSYATIEPDETRLAKIIARFPGRVDGLMVNATGAVVKKDEPLARIYSPRFLAAAQEYVQALAAQRTTEKDPQANAEAKRRAQEIAEFARRRLDLAGFTSDQLDAIAKSGKADERVTLYSPLAGTILEKNVLLGQMMEEGTTLYTIADLSTVWIQAQIIESDIEAVKVGMPVEVTTVSRPGEIFFGTVDFIYPTVDLETRSVRVRIVVANPDNKLRPGMYVTAVLRSPIGRYGEIGTPQEPKPEAGAKPEVKSAAGKTASAPASKELKLPTTTKAAAEAFLAALPQGAEYYVCPMHPEVVSDKPDKCPKCGMPLEKKTKTEMKPAVSVAEMPSTERWIEGYTCAMHLDVFQPKGGICQVCGCGMETTKWRVERVLSIPEMSVIDTGNSKIVYVEALPGIYDAHAVTLGSRAGAYYPVLAGLGLGERIVARGSFLIDAEARLNPTTTTTSGAATVSMPGMTMDPEEQQTQPSRGGGAKTGHSHNQ